MRPAQKTPVSLPWAPARASLSLVVSTRFEPNLRTTIVQAFARTLLDSPSKEAIAPGSSDARDSVPPLSMVALPKEGDLVG